MTDPLTLSTVIFMCLSATSSLLLTLLSKVISDLVKSNRDINEKISEISSQLAVAIHELGRNKEEINDIRLQVREWQRDLAN